MFIAYSDESGYCGAKLNKKQPIQIIASVLANAYNIHKTHKEFDYNLNVLRRNKIPLAELKAVEIYRGRNGWANVSADIRHSIFENYFRWVKKRNHKMLISSIDQGKFFASTSKFKNIFDVPYVAGAVHIALAIQKINNNLLSNKGKSILIFDEQKQYQNVVAGIIATPPKDILDYYPINKNEKPFEQIIDTAYFNSSHYSFLLQVADTTAFVYRLYFELNHYGFPESYKGEKVKINRWKNIIDKVLVPRSAMYLSKPKQDICKFYNEINP